MSSFSPSVFTEYFEQIDIDLVVGAMDRAWQVLQQLEPDDCTEEGRVTLALCVLSEARKGRKQSRQTGEQGDREVSLPAGEGHQRATPGIDESAGLRCGRNPFSLTAIQKIPC